MTVDDLRERIGTLSQVLRVDEFVESQGPMRGARRIRMVNGGGIEVEIHPDRALDLGQTTVDGIPLAWMSPNGITAPQFYEPQGNGWLRTFGGGLMATCGLDTFGPPGEDQGVELGQHGRIGTQPATVTRAEATVDGVVVEGRVRQTGVFAENLLLERRISSSVGSDTVTVDDIVTNEGFEETPHMVLYHVNFGWPLLDEATTIDIPSSSATPRDAAAEVGIERRHEVGPPAPGFQEQVYRHDFDTDKQVWLRVANAKLNLEVALGFSAAALPCAYQWKMTGQGHYVLGIEPANCRNIFGRRAARAAGELPMLAAGQRVCYQLIFHLRRIKTDGHPWHGRSR